MSLQLPPGFRPLRDLAANREKLLKARQQEAVRLRQLDVELKKAGEQDRRLFADRLAKDVDAKDPGPKKQDEVREQIAACKSRYDALADTVADAEQAIRDLIETNGPRWLATEQAELEKSRLAYGEAIEMLAGKRGELDAHQNLVRWLKNPTRDFKASPSPVHAKALVRPNGNPQSFSAVLDALREDAKPTQREPLFASHTRFGPMPQPAPEPELDRVA